MKHSSSSSRRKTQRNHLCCYCQKSCTRPCELAEHEANHRGEKTYTCECGQYGTSYRSNFRRHQHKCKVLGRGTKLSQSPGPSSTDQGSPDTTGGSPEASVISSPSTPAASLKAFNHDTATFNKRPIPLFTDVAFSDEYERSDCGTFSGSIFRTSAPMSVSTAVTLSQVSTTPPPLTFKSFDAYVEHPRFDGLDGLDHPQVHPALFQSGSHPIYDNEIPLQYDQFRWASLSPFQDAITRRDAVICFPPKSPSGSRMPADMNAHDTGNHLSDAHDASPLVGNLPDFGTLFN